MLTKRECAIITAYTGYTMLQGDDICIFYKYCEEILGRPVMDITFAFEDTWEELHEKCKADFLKLCEEARDEGQENTHKGKWIEYEDFAVCSECNTPCNKIRIEAAGRYMPFKTKYCPYCGVEMENVR